MTLSGIFLPIPYSGFRAIRAGLLTDTFLEVHHVVRMKEQYADMVRSGRREIYLCLFFIAAGKVGVYSKKNDLDIKEAFQ